MWNPRAAKSAHCLRRLVLYMTTSGRSNGGGEASCCLNGPKRLLMIVIEGR